MNTTLKFGDTLLTIAASALLACALITGAGCALLSGSATAEQKLSDVRNLSRAAASIGTQEAVLQNPMWLPRFILAKDQLARLVASKTVTGALLRDVIASLPVRELKSDRAVIIIRQVTLLFDASGSQIDIEKQPYVLAAAEGILAGMRDALGQ
jgi:hypothetical protein